MPYILLTAFIVFIINLYIRYRPTMHKADDGDIIIFYWDYVTTPTGRKKVRDYKRIYNIFK